jgi:hypothetical protein
MQEHLSLGIYHERLRKGNTSKKPRCFSLYSLVAEVELCCSKHEGGGDESISTVRFFCIILTLMSLPKLPFYPLCFCGGRFTNTERQ